MKKRKSGSFRRNLNSVNRSINNQAAQIRNSLSEIEKTLNKIASNEDTKNKKDKKTIILELTDELENELKKHIQEIEQLVAQDEIPECIHKNTCKNCAYYEYCYI